MGDVVEFPNDDNLVMALDSRSGCDPQASVGAAAQASLREVVIIGINEDGSIFAAASHAFQADTLLLIDRFKRKIMANFDEDTFG